MILLRVLNKNQLYIIINFIEKIDQTQLIHQTHQQKPVQYNRQKYQKPITNQKLMNQMMKKLKKLKYYSKNPMTKKNYLNLNSKK